MIGSQKAGNWVDAIDEGRIVRVSEEYAKREGLPIIRRPSMELQQFAAEKARVQPMSARERKGLLRFEEFRRPLKGDKGIANELKDNFHWEIARLRKAKGLTRKQVCQSLGVNEHDLRMFEYGVLAREDYVLVNKIENFYGINLRKDKSVSGSALQQALKSKEELEKKRDIVPKKEGDETKNVISGEEIDLVGEP